MNIEKYYKEDETVRAYINRFAIHRNISVEEAFKHKIVIDYVRWIIETRK
ncbi:MAG: hypothetical protein KBT27_02665 [Prevotellaceae bacterium]|nr:hypothetical protein [Candidatus Faecinaster equi]